MAVLPQGASDVQSIRAAQTADPRAKQTRPSGPSRTKVGERNHNRSRLGRNSARTEITRPKHVSGLLLFGAKVALTAYYSPARGDIMTTDVPDWYELGERVSEPFNLARVSIMGGSETAETLGQFLFHGLTNTDHLGDLMARHGYGPVADYIRERRVPTKLNIRVANFGEIASGHLLEEEEELIRPIEKLRYTFNHEWSPHLTDVFAVLVEDDEITTIAYCEVKAGTTSPDADVGANGYKDLLKAWRKCLPGRPTSPDADVGANGYKDKAWRNKTPEILHFTAERLWEAQRFDEYERLDRAMYGATPVPQLLRLVLIFDEAAWKDSVLDAVEAAVEQDAPPADSFVCYLVMRDDLRTLVNDSFEKMAEFAVHS